MLRQPFCLIDNKENANTEIEESPSWWKPPLKWIITRTEFLDRAKNYAYHIKEDGLSVNLQEFSLRSPKRIFRMERTVTHTCWLWGRLRPISINKRPHIKNVIWGQAKNHFISNWGPSSKLGENLAAYLIQLGQILSATSGDMNRRQSLEIMLDRKASISVHNCLYVESHKMPVTVTGRKATCLKCGKTGHFSFLA